MKIVVALYSNQLDSKIHPLFGRCLWFGVYDSLSKTVDYIENKIPMDEVSLTCPVAESLVSLRFQYAVGGGFSPKTTDLLLREKVQLIVPSVEMKLSELLSKLK